MSDSELEAFKTDMDLRLYAATLGYELDRGDSSRGNAVMRDGSDKIIIKQDRDGHYVYFSVRDPEDNGSIIDFFQRRTGLSLSHIREELRGFTGRHQWPIS